MIWRFLGHFNNLRALGASAGPMPVAQNDPLRRKLILLNIGAGLVRIYDKAQQAAWTADNGWPLIQNLPFTFGDANNGPTNELWATGEVNHDLYVMELVVLPQMRRQQ